MPSMRDEEQPARHGSALAADRRRGWNSMANVALLRLSLLCQEIDCVMEMFWSGRGGWRSRQTRRVR